MRDSNKSAPRNRGHRLTHLVRRLCAKNTGGGTTYIAAPSPLTEPVCLRPTPDGCTLTVRVHPGARRNAVTGFHDGALKIALTSPPVDGRANEALIAGQNEGIYVKNLPKDAVSSWALVKIGSAYTDPDTHDILGYEAIPTGEADLREVGPPATMILTKSPQEVEIGDRLLPLEPESFKADFYPHAPAQPVKGRIISVYGGVIEIAQYSIVAISRGSRDGLDPGTVLGIYQPGRKVTDPYGHGPVELPEEKAGELMVFKVTPRLSYGLVMIETRSSHVLDKVRGPTHSQR